MNHSVKRHRQALHQTQHHYYLNISVEAAKLSDWRIESNRNFYRPNWNALLHAMHALHKIFTQLILDFCLRRTACKKLSVVD